MRMLRAHRPAPILELGRLLRREALTGVCALVVVTEAAEAKQREKEIAGENVVGLKTRHSGATAQTAAQ